MKDPLVRMAGRIRRRLAVQADRRDEQLSAQAEYLLAAQRAVAEGWRRCEKAASRNWHAAARHSRDQLFFLVRQLHAAAGVMLNRQEDLCRRTDHSSAAAPPSLRTVHEELRQLHEEFEHVELDPKGGGCLVARTPPIVLEDLAVGPFAIELHVQRLDRSRSDSSCFDVVALKPNPAASNSGVTHPHVSDRVLCAGDASAPIAQALRQGRIADAFVLVRSVLNAYNPHSPYVAIDDWEGVRCGDCGDAVHSEDLYSCQFCDGEFCGHCTSCCELCDESACHGCIERDPVSRRDCCPNCRSACSRCGRVVDEDHFNQETDLCPECERQRSSEQLTPEPGPRDLNSDTRTDTENQDHECESDRPAAVEISDTHPTRQSTPDSDDSHPVASAPGHPRPDGPGALPPHFAASRVG